MEQSLEQPFSPLITSLPDDIIVDILARVPRCNYPAISLVSKHFRSLVESHEIYARRSLLGCTEACLYGYFYNTETNKRCFYILHRKANNNNRLVLIPLLRAMPFVRCMVVVGSRIYVFGKNETSSSFSIDCRSHTVQLLPRMPIPMEAIAADVIDKKIYVTGHTINEELKELKTVVAVYNTETKMWEPEVIKSEKNLNHSWFDNNVVVAGKIYMRDYHNSFVYEPKENKWETDEILNSMDWKYASVVDDVMYYYDIDNEVRAYDTKNKCWSVVKGVGESFPNRTKTYCSNTVSYGEKLAVFLRENGELLFREIAIERRKEERFGVKLSVAMLCVKET